MPKRKLVILSLLVVVFLICSPSALTFGAEKGPRTGNIVSDCIFLKEIGGHTIKIIRDSNFCAERVTYHKNPLCQGEGEKVEAKGKPSKTPTYCIGNPFCSESIKVHYKPNPGYCYEYNSGGNTRYIPPGCNE